MLLHIMHMLAGVACTCPLQHVKSSTLCRCCLMHKPDDTVAFKRLHAPPCCCAVVHQGLQAIDSDCKATAGRPVLLCYALLCCDTMCCAGNRFG